MRTYFSSFFLLCFTGLNWVLADPVYATEIIYDIGVYGWTPIFPVR